MGYLRDHMDAWARELKIRRSEFGNMPTCPCAAKTDLVLCAVEDAWELDKLLPRLSSIEPNQLMVIHVLEAKDAREVLSAHAADLASRNMLALPSDPDNPVYIAGVRTTQHKYYLVLIQNKLELERVSESIRHTGYYDNWSPEQLAWLTHRA